MKNNVFIYNGVKFRSEGRLTEKAMTNALANEYKGNYKLDGYNHKEFYEVAKAANAYDDMFTIIETGELVIPCSGGICII